MVTRQRRHMHMQACKGGVSLRGLSLGGLSLGGLYLGGLSLLSLGGLSLCFASLACQSASLRLCTAQHGIYMTDRHALHEHRHAPARLPPW